MTLLVFICNDPEKLEEILEGYLEVGITGSTVIDTLGMGHILATRVPIFAGFQSLAGTSAYNKTIFSVIQEREKVEVAFDIIERVCGPLGNPGVGIAFTIPIEEVRGLKPELE
jgi:nitrogen regulatory protein PII